MKKSVVFLMVLILSLLSYPFIETSATNQTILDVTISGNHLILSSSNLYAAIDLEDVEKYTLTHQIVGELDTHLISDGIHIIASKTIASNYLLEVLFLNNKGFETYTSSLDETLYLLIKTDATLIDSDSDIGYNLRSVKTQFEENHYIENGVLASNSLYPYEPIPLSELTNSDQYIDGYKPSYKIHGVQYQYHDSIVNIVPEAWFTTVGTHVYFGREYGLYVVTRKVNQGMFQPQYVTIVNVYDIEVSLPFFNENNGAVQDDVFQYSYDFDYSIEPVISMEYESYDKSFVGQSIWTNSFNFDPNTAKMIIPKLTGNPKVFVAPSSNVLQINPNIPQNVHGNANYGIRDFTFEMTGYISNETIESMRLLNLKSNIFPYTEFITGMLVSGIPLGSLVNSATHLMLNLHNQSEIDRLQGQIKQLDYMIDSVGYFKSYSGGPWDQYPEVFAMDLKDNSHIFCNQVIGQYALNFRYSIESYNLFDREAIFELAISNKFNFYDHLGNIMLHNGVSREITTHQSYISYHQNFIRDTQNKAFQFDSSFSSTSFIETPYEVSIYSLKSYTDQVIVLNASSSTVWNAVVEIYNSKGQLITRMDTGSLRKNHRLIKLDVYGNLKICTSAIEKSSP